MNERLTIFLCFALVSLAAATLLYFLFGRLNTAGYEWVGNKEVQLGGPIAAFVIVLATCPFIYNQINNSLEKRLKNIVGTWEIESESSKQKRKAHSETTIELVNEELHVSGGTFFDVDANGIKGAAIGVWDTDMAISDGHKLTYLYNLRDNLSSSSAWRGIAELTLQGDMNNQTLVGRWQIIGGNDVHNGQIVMKKIIK